MASAVLFKTNSTSQTCRFRPCNLTNKTLFPDFFHPSALLANASSRRDGIKVSPGVPLESVYLFRVVERCLIGGISEDRKRGFDSL